MSPCKNGMTHCESGEPCCGVKRGSGETHISSSGTRPSLCTRPGVDLLRAIAAANTHHASLQRKVKGTGPRDRIQIFVQTVLVVNKYLPWFVNFFKCSYDEMLYKTAILNIYYISLPYVSTLTGWEIAIRTAKWSLKYPILSEYLNSIS
jgi:hypothetical protein